MRRLTIAAFAALFCTGSIAHAQTKGHAAMPHILVYKTKKQYRKHVAVQLSNDKKSIQSYPDPADVKTGSNANPVLPVSLHNGYLLDKRGVSMNTAFIKLTYEEYAKLPVAPSPEELYGMIIDKNPITELCDCGTRGKFTVKQLNGLIDSNRLRKDCKVIK